MMTFDEIGLKLGISRQRAEQIFKSGMRKLRHPAFKKEVEFLFETLGEINKTKCNIMEKNKFSVKGE